MKRVQISFAPVPQNHHLRAIRFWLAIVMAGLILSGATAFPLETELHFFLTLLQSAPLRPFAELPHLLPWISQVHDALTSTNRNYPFLAYGTDWLAFAHLVIAVAFIGPYRDPLRNKWVITFGLIASAGVIPLALIAGQVRGYSHRLATCGLQFRNLCRDTTYILPATHPRNGTNRVICRFFALIADQFGWSTLKLRRHTRTVVKAIAESANQQTGEAGARYPITKMTTRYAHLAPAHKLAAVDRLTEYRKEQEEAESSAAPA